MCKCKIVNNLMALVNSHIVLHLLFNYFSRTRWIATKLFIQGFFPTFRLPKAEQIPPLQGIVVFLSIVFIIWLNWGSTMKLRSTKKKKKKKIAVNACYVDEFCDYYKSQYLTIIRRRRGDYRGIFAETKSRWIFPNNHRAWGE
jgi:hypothetical protein